MMKSILIFVFVITLNACTTLENAGLQFHVALERTHQGLKETINDLDSLMELQDSISTKSVSEKIVKMALFIPEDSRKHTYTTLILEANLFYSSKAYREEILKEYIKNPSKVSKQHNMVVLKVAANTQEALLQGLTSNVTSIGYLNGVINSSLNKTYESSKYDIIRTCHLLKHSRCPEDRPEDKPEPRKIITSENMYNVPDSKIPHLKRNQIFKSAFFSEFNDPKVAKFLENLEKTLKTLEDSKLKACYTLALEGKFEYGAKIDFYERNTIDECLKTSRKRTDSIYHPWAPFFTVSAKTHISVKKHRLSEIQKKAKRAIKKQWYTLPQE